LIAAWSVDDILRRGNAPAAALVRDQPFRIFSVQTLENLQANTKTLISLALPRGLEPAAEIS
jgi:hypothetical protein